MSIEKIGSKFYLYCDICGEEAERVFSEFDEAVKYKMENKWRSQKKNGEWEDVCPECLGKA